MVHRSGELGKGEEWQVWKEDVTNGNWVIRSSGGREMAAGADAYDTVRPLLWLNIKCHHVIITSLHIWAKYCHN